MNLSRLFSACFFGHADDPVIVMDGKTMHYACRRCQADMGVVLAGQKFKARRLRPRKRPSAKVLRMAKREVG